MLIFKIVAFLFEAADWILLRLPRPLRGYLQPVVDKSRNAFVKFLLSNIRGQTKQLGADIERM